MPNPATRLSQYAVLMACLLCLVLSSPLYGQVRACRPSTHSALPRQQLEKAIEVLGLASVGDRIRVSPATDVVSMDYQSDRTYPPYLRSTTESRVLAGWKDGLLRIEQGGGRFAILSDPARQAVVSARGAQMVPSRTPNVVDSRAMDAWLVLSDWRRAADLRAAGECLYRDYWRSVIARGRGNDEERLFLDPKSGFPVKLERREEHILWGDVNVEYLWSIWTPVGGTSALAPRYTFRLVEGEVQQERMASAFAFAPDSGLLRIPDSVAALVNMPPFVPDTVRVSATTFVLRTPSYTNVVTLQRDTVWVLDAQTNEDRARQDSLWIGRLFPGTHKIAVLVTDLAFPHIGGVRYWVANGATIVSHSNSEAFLRRVVNRRWTYRPDLLSRNTKSPFRFRAVNKDMEMAQGDLRVVPIDGIGSEGALLVYITTDRLLYAGDYIQSGGLGSFSAVYAREVVAAVKRAGLTPTSFVAMHVPLTGWNQLPRFGAEP